MQASSARQTRGPLCRQGAPRGEEGFGPLRTKLSRVFLPGFCTVSPGSTLHFLGPTLSTLNRKRKRTWGRKEEENIPDTGPRHRTTARAPSVSSAHRSADWPIPQAPGSGVTGQCRGEALSDQKAELGPSRAHSHPAPTWMGRSERSSARGRTRPEQPRAPGGRSDSQSAHGHEAGWRETPPEYGAAGRHIRRPPRWLPGRRVATWGHLPTQVHNFIPKPLWALG